MIRAKRISAKRRRAAARPAVLSAALAVIILGFSPTQAQTPDSIAQGQEIYGEFCASCHGRNMSAGALPGADLRTFPKDGAERFRNAVLDGKGTAMPAWRGRLSDDDIDLLWAYVRSAL